MLNSTTQPILRLVTSDSPCSAPPHRWKIPPPEQEPLGECRTCGATKLFSNAPPEFPLAWTHLYDRNDGDEVWTDEYREAVRLVA